MKTPKEIAAEIEELGLREFQRQAQQQFQTKCQGTIRNTGWTWDRAFQHHKQVDVALWNTVTTKVHSPGTKRLLGLSASASQEEANVAYEANGGVFEPRYIKKIWAGLIAWRKEKFGESDAQATEALKEHPIYHEVFPQAYPIRS